MDCHLGMERTCFLGSSLKPDTEQMAPGVWATDGIFPVLLVGGVIQQILACGGRSELRRYLSLPPTSSPGDNYGCSHPHLGRADEAVQE